MDEQINSALKPVRDVMAEAAVAPAEGEETAAATAGTSPRGAVGTLGHVTGRCGEERGDRG